MPTRAYSASSSGVRAAVTGDELELAAARSRLNDETPTLRAMKAASPTLASDVLPPEASRVGEAIEPAPADSTHEGEFFEGSPRYTMTSVAPPAMKARRAPRLIAKKLARALGAGVLLLGVVELALACFR